MYEELKSVLDYIVSSIVDSELVELHKQLAQYYEQARTSPSAEVTENITATQKKIKSAQESTEPKDWDKIKLRNFEGFGATTVLGRSGYSRLVKELSQHSNDPHGASQVAERFSTEITSLKQRAEQAINSLGPLLAEPEELPKGKQKIQLVFEDMVAIEELESLKDQAREWDIILKTFRHMVPEPDGEAKLYKMYKSSPVVIVIIAGVPLIIAVLKITKEALDIVEKLWSIRKLKAEAKVAELDADIKQTMLDNLTQAEEKKLDELVEEKVKTVIDEYRDKLSKTQVEEAENAARYNLKKIYNFTVKGGAVNIVDGEVKDGNVKIEQSQFSPTYSKAKELLKSNEGALLLASFSKKEEQEAEDLAAQEVEKPKEKSNVEEATEEMKKKVEGNKGDKKK